MLFQAGLGLTLKQLYLKKYRPQVTPTPTPHFTETLFIAVIVVY